MSFLSHAIVRRYSSPTSVLEITAQESALSQWMGQPVLKNLRFQLTFDPVRDSDPPRPAITLRGDRAQLETLTTTVSAYVHTWLAREPETPNHRDALSLEAGAIALLSPPPPALTSDPETTPVHAPDIVLQRQGLLSHALVLGSLQTPDLPPSITLSTIQLADLSTILDEYNTETLALPLDRSARRGQTPPAWLRTAALVVMTAGVTAVSVKLFERTQPVLQTASAPPTQPNSQSLPSPLFPSPLAVPGSPVPSGAKLPAPPANTPTAKTAPASPDANSEIAAIPMPPPPSNLPAPPPLPAPSSLPDVSIVAPERSAIASPDPAPTAKKTEPNSEDSPPVRSIDKARSSETEGLPSLSASSAADQAAAPAPPTAQGSQTSLFDTVPQVAEARTFFQKRWQTPPGLTQVLEYNLTVGANGTIQSIKPLGQAAGKYIDRTGMPLVGEPFVSPLQGQRSARIRLVLSPDGSVQTFLE